MNVNLKIVKKTDGSFTPREGGEKIPYFWYTAIRKNDQVEFQFGSKNDHYEEGDELELPLVKSEGRDGRPRWKESTF